MAKLKKKLRTTHYNKLQHIDKCNQSGEEKKNPPPYFKELRDIYRKVEDTGKENSFKKAKKNNEKKQHQATFWVL